MATCSVDDRLAALERRHEDVRLEFKCHPVVCIEELSDRQERLNDVGKIKRRLQPWSKFVTCMQPGVTDKHHAEGLMLTPHEVICLIYLTNDFGSTHLKLQKRHLHLSLEDTLARFTPKVDAKFMRKTGVRVSMTFTPLHETEKTSRPYLVRVEVQPPTEKFFSRGSEATHADVHEEISFYLALVLLFVCACGVLGNIMSAYVFTRPVMRVQSINVLLAALSCIDALLLLLVGPAFALPAVRAKLHLSQAGGLTQALANVTTLLLYPSALVLQTASVWLFVVISFERYVAVCNPLKVTTYCTTARARAAVVTVLLASAVYNACRYFEYRWGDGYCDSPYQYLREEPAYVLWYMAVGYVLLNYALPLLCIGVLNWRLVRTMRAAQLSRRQLATNVKGEHSTTKMMLVVIIIFAACYSLSAILAIVDAAHPKFYEGERATLAFALLDLNNALVVGNSAGTWIIYYAFSGRYRTIAKATVILACPPLARLCCGDIETFVDNRETRYLGYSRTLRKSLHMPAKADHQRQNTYHPLRAVDVTPVRDRLRPALCVSQSGPGGLKRDTLVRLESSDERQYSCETVAAGPIGNGVCADMFVDHSTGPNSPKDATVLIVAPPRVSMSYGELTGSFQDIAQLTVPEL